MKRALIIFLVGSLLLVAVEEMRDLTQRKKRYWDMAINAPPMLFVSTARGSKKTVILPDGSTVTLNAASTLSYPATMADGSRTVELLGEGYFDVAAKSCFPFKVRAKEMMIEVLGTRFNVRSYPDEPTTAFVTAGAVKVSCHNHTMVLHPGSEAAIGFSNLNGCALQVRNTLDTATTVAWTKGLLTFTDADLRSLLRELSRIYNVDIQLEGKVSDHRFQGSLSLQESVDQVLERLVIPYTNVTITRPDKQRLIISVNK